jgi:hypothetical protein
MARVKMRGGFISDLGIAWSMVIVISIVIVVIGVVGLGLWLGLTPKPTNPVEPPSPPIVPNTNLKPGNASLVTAVTLQNARTVTHPLSPYKGQQSELIIDAVPAQNDVDHNSRLHYIADYTYKTEYGHSSSYYATSNRFTPPPGNLVVDISGTDVEHFESVGLTVWIENPAGAVGPKYYFAWPINPRV